MTVITNEEFARNPFDPQPAPFGPVQRSVPPSIPEPIEGVERQGTLGAGFSRENILKAEADRQRIDKNLVKKQAEAELDGTFDLGAHIPERHLGFAQVYVDNAIDPESAELITQRLDQQIDDDLVLHSSGMEGIAMRMLASVSDPTSLPVIPLSMMSKMGTLGKVLTGSGVVGASVAAQEAFLQHSQDTRTLEETNVAVGTSLLVGGFLGPLLSKSNPKLLDEAIQEAKVAVRGNKKTYSVAISPQGPVKISIDPESFRAKFSVLDCP